jgi:sugar/nucleoside kinase (ribokinase family)
MEVWDAGIEALCGRLDVLFVNRAEACALGKRQEWRRAARELARRVPLLVVKSGPDGSSIVQGEKWQDSAGFPVAAVDPTGAGDAFNAGFLFGFLAGRPLAECATWGNACGALTVAQPGGSGAFASRLGVEAFIRAQAGAGRQG